MTVYRVYKDTCIVSGKSYIGITKHTPKERWYSKCHKALQLNFSYKISCAIRKYGPEPWTHEVLYCTKDLEHVYTMEKYFIGYFDTYNNGYNSTIGGEYPEHEELQDDHKLAISKGLKSAYETGKRKPVSHDESVRQRIREAKSTGIWKTPLGDFLSAREAAKALNTSKTNIKNWCKNPDKIVTHQSPNRLPHVFDKSDIGKTFNEVGFSFSSNEP